MCRELLCLFCFVLLIKNVRTTCDGQTGPVGMVDCISVDGYSMKQWGTCLTDSYIRQKSGNQHRCANQTRTYCYYQCMLELYDVSSGTVTSTCICNDSSISTTTQGSPTTSSLSGDCLSPDGSSCSWYEDCLEHRYSCQNTPAGYAIEYMTKFCNLYTTRKDKFTSIGQQWIDGVRKCLQVEFVPFLRPFQHVNCLTIHDKAFASYTPCYLNPDFGITSICKLDFLVDWLQIFWTIKSSYDHLKPSIALASLHRAYEMIKSCYVDRPIMNYQAYYRQLQLTIDIIKTTTINLSTTGNEELNAIVLNIINRMNDMFLKISQDDFGLYGYFVTFSTEPSRDNYRSMIIEFHLADLQAINNNINSTNTRLDAVVNKFKSELIKGNLLVQNDDGLFYIWKSSNCVDMNCEATWDETVAPSYSPKNNANTVNNFYLIYALFLLKDIFFQSGY